MNTVKIVGVGSYLPEKILSNEELSRTLDTSHDWILQRTGIAQRHIAAPHQKTSDLGAHAGKNALTNANLSPEDLDFIICTTTTPDHTFPATATKIQHLLGAKNAFSFDLQAACCGFVYALTVGSNFIKTGQYQRGLVIGADTYSRIVDWTDRSTAILFGDGAGAVVLEKSTAPGILDSYFHADGSLYDLLYVDGGPASSEKVGKIKMDGREVFKHAIHKLADSLVKILEKTRISVDQIDWFVPHQANERIIDATAEKLGFPLSKTIKTVAQHGNTSAASIPLALDWAVKKGNIQKGDLVLIDALGGGLTWGSCLIRW